MSQGGARKSLARQLLEEEARISAGGEPQKRQKNSDAAHAAVQAEEAPSSEEEQPVIPQEYEFVEEDDEGEDYHISKPKDKAKRVRGPAPVGPSPKIKTDVTDDPSGTWLEAADGRVKINLYKMILRRVTAEGLKQKSFLAARDSPNKSITTSHYECLVFSSTSSAKHNRFVAIGENSGNLKKHCDRYHEEMLDSLERMVKELPAEEAKDTIRQHSGAWHPCPACCHALSHPSWGVS